MRKIDESKITSDKSMFFKQGTWTHLQKAYQEPITETIKAMIGSGYDATKMYVLNGCINSGSGSSFIISAGSVFYDGEVYLVDAVSFTTSGGNVAVATITTTNNTTDYSADPCEFSDGSLENVHNIRKVVIASGASGSGTKNYSAFDFDTFKYNYKDITSQCTVIGAITPTTFSVREYNDGTISVFLTGTYSGAISAGNLITGLPTAHTQISTLRAYIQDAVPTISFIDIIYATGTILSNITISGSYNTIVISYTYKKL